MTLMEVREAIRMALVEEMERDPSVFLLGEEIAEYDGAYKVTRGLLSKFGPKRVLDTPIAEASFSGLAIGAAMAGLRPVVEFMSFNFSFVAFDQIISHAAKMYFMTNGRFQVPIVFRGPNGPGPRVSSQHSHDVASLYAHFPGLKVVAPFTPSDYKGLLKSAIRDGSPVLFLEHELEYNTQGEVPVGEILVPFGQARIAQIGSDLTLVSYGRGVRFCLEAAEIFAKKGISIEVIDLRSIRPLDLGSIVKSVRKTHRLLILTEGYETCSIASEIGFHMANLALDALDCPIERLGQRESPMPYAANLERQVLATTERLIEKIKRMFHL